jgi:crotonobetainyl-CoA:carnitine CoA-transferase CaiB-like acyl-CoA transferase
MRWNKPQVGGTSAQNWITDRNKSSVALDLKDPRGVAAFKALARTADVVLEGFRPGVVARLGVAYEDLRPLKPSLVYCSLTGYGQDGPLAAAPGHDLNYVGRAGLVSLTGPADGAPAVPGVQVGDLGGGALMALVGLLAALVRARETGEGDYVDISMTDGAFAWLSIQLGNHLATGVVPGREGVLLNGRFPCYNVYECADGRWLTVGAIEERFFTELCGAMGRPELVATRMDADAVPVWRELFKARTRDEWLALLGPLDTCVGPVNDMAEAVADEQLRSRGMVVDQVDGDGQAHPQLGPPIKLRNRPATLRSPAPRLGQDTEHYLRDAGLTPDDIAGLIA